MHLWHYESSIFGTVVWQVNGIRGLNCENNQINNDNSNINRQHLLSSVFQSLAKLLKSVISMLSVSFRWVTTPKRSGLILDTGCTTV